ncbi:multidrug effflux MFS transporter [Planobispora siamensis]|uniref:Bcr/CflA family drug resistance efflux transporter n=1 Tax=Planobispora siamensis TaxID=936338 RepID=A0A8J3SIC5_9ACTN|nr:multidrug effflux MFS transporter [Planobispora siamensis]GIH93507.1 Bcr/CflA family drug resistance efflux transporter [Planobispora siamensis]
MTAAPVHADSPTSPITHAHGRTRMFILLGALTSIGPLAIDLYLPALPRLAADLGASASAAQLSLTSFMVGLGTGQVVVGPLSDAFGRRRPLLIGFAAFCAVSALCAASPSIGVLVALRLLQGLTAATGVALTKAVVRDLYGGVEAARFFSMLMLVTGLVPLLAPMLGAQLLRVVPWPGLFGVITAAGGLLWLTALLALPETHPPHLRTGTAPGAVARSMVAVLRHRRFMALTLTAAFASGAMFCYISGASFVLQEVYGLSPQGFSVLFGMNSAGMIITGQLAGRLAGRVSMRLMLAAGLALSAVAGVLLLVAALAGLGLPVVTAALFLMTSGQGMIYPMALTMAMSSQPTSRAGSASALFGLVQWVTGGITGPISGAFGTGTVVPLAVTVAVMGLAAGLSGAVLLRRTHS